MIWVTSRSFLGWVVAFSLLVCDLTTRLPAQVSPSAQNPPHILVINSYHPGYNWSDVEQGGLLLTLEQARPNILPSIEYLDWRRFPDAERVPVFLDQLDRKYRARRFDVVVALDEPALDLVLKHRTRFGDGVPVVFGGINDFDPELLKQHRELTGVEQRHDFAGTLKLIHALQPDLKRLVVVNCPSESGRASRHSFERYLAQHPETAPVEWVDENWSGEELLKTLGGYTRDSAILLLSIYRDRTGRVISDDGDFAKALSERSGAPIYFLAPPIIRHFGDNSWETASWQGLGGSLLMPDRHGEAVAKLVLRVLAGERAGNIPVLTNTPSRMAVDDRQLHRFGLAVGRLPVEAVRYRKLPSFYEAHRSEILVAVCVSGLLGGVIVVLIWVILKRRRAELALRESEANFRKLFESTPDGLLEVDAVGKIIMVNAWVESAFGYRREDLREARLTRLLPDLVRQFPGVHPGAEAAEPLVVGQVKAVLARRKDGTEFPADVSLNRFVSQGSEFVVVAVRDTSERRRAEIALQESEARLRLSIRAGDIGLWEWNTGTGDAYFSPELKAHLGLVGEELAGRFEEWQARVHPDDLPVAMARLRDIVSGASPTYECEFRLRHQDGSYRWIYSRGEKSCEPGGTGTRLIGCHIDITKRKQAEEALRESRAKLVLAMEMVKLGHWEYDVASDRFTFDDDFYRLLGTTAAQEGGKYMSAAECARRIPAPGEEHIVAAEINRAIATTDPHFSRQLEHGFLRPDGTLGVMAVRFSIAKDAAGRTVRIFGANQDVTEQRRAEKQREELESQLRQAQKLEALGTLAGGIAHDFNNILGAIISFAELSKLENENQPELHSNLDQILNASKRATSLVRQILSFSRQQKQERKHLQLRPVVEEAMTLLRSTLPATIEIQQEFTADLPAVLADPTQVHQLVMNLGTNALHAMRGWQGRLVVRLDGLRLSCATPMLHAELRAGEYVRLSFSDTGHGMDAATLKRIYEPFFTTKGPGEGTGLGLSVVHGIVKEHDGVITVESAPGQGTTFTIYFPALPELAAGDVEGHEDIPRGHGERVLFVDDEPALCEVAEKIIQRLGYEPAVFTSSEKAWDAIQKAPRSFDLMLTDQTMPVMTGLDLARKVLALRPGLPIILTSGYGGTLTIGAVRDLGLRGLVYKPLDYAALGQAIGQVFSEAPVTNGFSPLHPA